MDVPNSVNDSSDWDKDKQKNSQQSMKRHARNQNFEIASGYADYSIFMSLPYNLEKLEKKCPLNSDR